MFTVRLLSPWGGRNSLAPGSPHAKKGSDYVDPEILETFRVMVLGGDTPEAAALRLQKLTGVDDSTREKILEAYRTAQEGWQRLKIPAALKAKDGPRPWYPGPDQPGAWCWPAYKQMLQSSPGWTKAGLDALDEASTKILAHLPPPATENHRTRGLVVGYVQSGKTANYSGLIAKAVDVHFKLIIVLAGTTENLRRQTQERLEADICSHHPDQWRKLTFSESDFGYTQDQPDSVLTPKNPHLRVICVVKKNKDVLRNLIAYFGSANPNILQACSTIVIDDEADHASINTKVNRTAEAEKKRSEINKLILDVLRLFPRSSYIGYTATPFANVFIDPTSPDDLFPRSFIFALPRPAAYFGTEQIFGRDVFWFDESNQAFEGMNIVRHVQDRDPKNSDGQSEVELLSPGKKEKESFDPQITPSLERALLYFLLATACRYARGQDDEHSSMLVHVSLFKKQHTKLQALLATFIESLRQNGGWRKRIEELRSIWTEECARTASAAEGKVTEFPLVIARFEDVLRRCEVVIDNSDEDAELRLVYPKKGKGPTKVYIGIGGNTLSRGLTLEGLIVSYFIRVASNYDTLLQMGRWFGYRRGYEDLPRVWMTRQLETYFLFLAGVEEEIRQDINRLEDEGRSPLDFAIRVQTHPRLQVTARNKRGTARPTALSFGNTREQSFYFRNTDEQWLTDNLTAGRDLISGLCSPPPDPASGPPYVFRGRRRLSCPEVPRGLPVPRTARSPEQGAPHRVHQQGARCRFVESLERRGHESRLRRGGRRQTKSWMHRPRTRARRLVHQP